MRFILIAVCLLLIFLSSFAFANGEVKEPSSIKEVTAQLNKAVTDEAIEQLINSGVDLISQRHYSTVTDDLEFLDAIVQQGIKNKKYESSIGRAAKDIEEKYKDDPSSLYKVLIHEAMIYRDQLHDFAKASELYNTANLLGEKLIIDQELEQLRLNLSMGENFLSIKDEKMAEENKKHAQVNFMRVVEFPLFDDKYKDHVEELMDLYVRAALNIVSLTPLRDIHTLSFYPFAFDAIEKLDPKKAKLISKIDPAVKAFQERLIFWLQATSDDLPEKDPLKGHLDAMIKYIKKEQTVPK